MSKTYVIADLHGRADLLDLALEAIRQRAAAVSGEKSTVITLGDYIDRGPQSRQVIECLMSVQVIHGPLICLKGNHEDIMWQTIRKPLSPQWWFSNGGAATLTSYGGQARRYL